MPADFLIHIESQQIELDLGNWVIDAALKQANQWHQRGLLLPVSVNVSGLQLMDPQFLERLTALLYQYPNLPREHFELELLETCAIDDSMNVANVIASCRRMGLRVSLDDFGTGYSTLSHLRDLAVDTLKIDRSFVQDMVSNPGNIAIIKGIIAFAEAFNCKAIAEGIESADQQTALLQLGCQTGQGYHIARPMPGESIEPWLTGRHTSTSH